MKLPFAKPRPGPVARVKAGVEQMRHSVGAALFVAVMALLAALVAMVTR
jgi:hypothetical protein